MVDGVRDVAPVIREITLKPDAPIASYPLGSHINVSVTIDGEPVSAAALDARGASLRA